MKFWYKKDISKHDMLSKFNQTNGRYRHYNTIGQLNMLYYNIS